MTWIDEVLSEGVVPDDIPAEVAPASDVDEVNRLLRRLRSVEAKQTRLDTTRDAEVAAVKAWHDEETAKLTSARDFIERALDGWARAIFRTDKTKTHNLPHGTLSLRPLKAKVIEVDPDAAEAIKRASLDDLLRVKLEVDKHEVAKLDAGEVVNNGVEPGTRDRELTYKVTNPVTGEIIKGVVPGVVIREAVPGERGLKFTVKTK